jgi:hypothetical protein
MVKEKQKPLVAYQDRYPALALLDPEVAEGKAMKGLTPKAKAFVMTLVELGGKNLDQAAAAAGYVGSRQSLHVMASRLAADPRVQAALIEEAKALARSSSLAAVAVTLDILMDPTADKKTRLSAASRIMNLSSLEPDKTVNVNHTVEVRPTSQEQVDQVIQLAKDTGVDPRKLLGKAGIILDAEFKVMQDTTGLEDLL